MKSEAALGGKGRGREIARENEREKGQRKQKESPKRGRKYAKGEECAELCGGEAMEKLIRRAFFLYPSYHLSMRAKDERLMTSVWMGVYPKWKNKAF